MKLLLDTHTFNWWADQPEKLLPDALSALEDEANELLLSVASVGNANQDSIGKVEAQPAIERADQESTRGQ